MKHSADTHIYILHMRSFSNETSDLYKIFREMNGLDLTLLKHLVNYIILRNEPSIIQSHDPKSSNCFANTNKD